jgi:hypothetical protein
MIKLGDIVRDTVSGFEGVVIAEHQWLNGCKRISVQPQKLHDGKPIEAQTFDEPQLELVAPRTVQRKVNTGGPRNEPARPTVPNRR